MAGDKHQIPQYLSSNDPAVLAVIAANEEGYDAFAREAEAFATKYGVPNTLYAESASHARGGSFQGRHHVSGVTGRMPTVGDWTRTDSGWRPFKKNPIFAEMAAIRFQETPVPGLPVTVTSETTADGRLWWMSPHPIVHEGTAWVGLGRPGTASTELGQQWTEVFGSKYMAAVEALNATNKAINEAKAA